MKLNPYPNPSKIRVNIARMVLGSNEGHIASSYSIVEMLLGVYNALSTTYREVDLRSIVLSKGHAAYAYYAFLAEIGLMSEGEINSIGKFGSKYFGHVPYIKNDVRFSFGAGSLGHGMPYAVGLAYARMLSNVEYPVACIIGDGEANEGTFWESLLLSQKLGLAGLNILIDCNKSSERAVPINVILERLGHAFQNIDFLKCDGHNTSEIADNVIYSKSTRVILCDTQKGYPIPFMINNPSWHHRVPDSSEFALIESLLI